MNDTLVRRLLARSLAFGAGALLFALYLLLRAALGRRGSFPGGAELAAWTTGAFTWGVFAALAQAAGEGLRASPVKGALAAWGLAASGNLLVYAQWSYALGVARDATIASGLAGVGHAFARVLESRAPVEVALAVASPLGVRAFFGDREVYRAWLRLTAIATALSAPLLLDLLDQEGSLVGIAFSGIFTVSVFLPRMTWLADRFERPAEASP